MCMFVCVLLGLTSSASTSSASASPSHVTLIGWICCSTISYGLTLNLGLKMALWSAQPRDTASSAFMVVERPLLTRVASRSRYLERARLTHATRVAPPTSSTVSRFLASMPDSARARRMGASRRARREAEMSSNFSLEREAPKSYSSTRHSTEILASFTPLGDRVFLACGSHAHG